MKQSDAEDLVKELIDAAFEAGKHRNDPDESRIWREEATKISDKIVRHLTTNRASIGMTTQTGL